MLRMQPRLPLYLTYLVLHPRQIIVRDLPHRVEILFDRLPPPDQTAPNRDQDDTNHHKEYMSVGDILPLLIDDQRGNDGC